MGKFDKDYDINPLLESINAYQSIYRGCFEAHKSILPLMRKLKSEGKTLEKVYFVEKLDSEATDSPAKSTLGIDLEVILTALNKTKTISLAALELEITPGHLTHLIKNKGYKLSKRWDVVDL